MSLAFHMMKKRKMAEGGMVNKGHDMSFHDGESKEDAAEPYDVRHKRHEDHAGGMGMAHGGAVEKSLIDHHQELEGPFAQEHEEHNPYDMGNKGKGFSSDEILGEDESMDIESGKFAKGGVACYADGGHVGVPATHPLDEMFRKKFLEAKKMAYGGHVEPEEKALAASDYPEQTEPNREIDRRTMSEHKPAEELADEDPKEDKDRLAFAHSYLTRSAMRKRA